VLERAIEIAREAGRLIMQVRESADLSLSMKIDESPVTRADLIANKFICEALVSLSGLPVISEEENTVAFDNRKDWPQFWLVDPLDGTKEFMTGENDFTVNIALIRDSIPVLGVIYAPALDDLYFASQGAGAFVVRKGQQTKLPSIRLQDTVVGRSRYHDSQKLTDFLNAKGISKTAIVGGALKFGRLAEGVINLYPRFVGSKEWDIGAGHAILREARCNIIDLTTGKAPQYNKPVLRNNHFVAYAEGIDSQMIDGLLGEQT
jgi:3'(2'), 5'-bisphosphate nucleotidase